MVLTTSTLNGIRQSSKDEIVATFLYFAVGDGDTPASVGDTVLGNETFRQARESFDADTFPAEVGVTGEVGYTQNNSETIREFGWFDASSGGNLKQRAVLNNEIIKTNDIKVIFPSRATITVVQL